MVWVMLMFVVFFTCSSYSVIKDVTQYVPPIVISTEGAPTNGKITEGLASNKEARITVAS